jgi:hypothetical protein
MRLSQPAVLLVAACVTLAAAAGNTHKVNPMGLAYRSVEEVSLYAQPGGMLITGRCNRYDAAFMLARAAGAEILAYLNPVEVTDHAVCKLNEEFYMGDTRQVPLWPYPAEGARMTITWRICARTPGGATTWSPTSRG